MADSILDRTKPRLVDQFQGRIWILKIPKKCRGGSAIERKLKGINGGLTRAAPTDGTPFNPDIIAAIVRLHAQSRDAQDWESQLHLADGLLVIPTIGREN